MMGILKKMQADGGDDIDELVGSFDNDETENIDSDDEEGIDLHERLVDNYY